MKQFKKLAMVIAGLWCCMAVNAHDFEVDGIYYNFLTTTEVEVTFKGSYNPSYDEYAGKVEIPESVAYNGKTYSVTTIRDYAFMYNARLASITIPNSVTSIGNFAFRGCTGLASITIPNSVTSIGDDAFYGCTGLASITIPNSVTSIGIYAFQDCTGLASITIPNSVTSIGNHAFKGCTGLKTIINYSSLDISASAHVITADEQIGDFFFYKTMLTGYVGNQSELTLPEDYNGKKYMIGPDAFRYNTNLTSVFIPASVTGIEENAFIGCGNLASITIPNSVTSIGNDAFYGCKGLASITIPNSVTSIGNWAFSYCTGLTSITIPNSVTSIGNYAFKGCTGLTSITIPNSVTSIGNDAFSDCTGLASITIPNSVTSIGNGAFRGCTGLASINIPNSVTSIGEYAFSGCKGLASINIPNSVTSIGKYIFEECKGLTSITIPNSVTSIGNGAFSACKGLASITIPNSVTSIGNDAFSGCTELASITIPNSVTSIGNWAFSGCTELASITIPNSVTSIGNGAFRGCTGLTSIIVDKENSVYESKDNCNAIIEKENAKLVIGCKSTVIPNSVTSIGNYAFRGCTGLTSITIPNSVTTIGSEAFSGCSGLKTVINYSSLDISAGSSDHGYVAKYADKVLTSDEQIGDFFFYKTKLAVYVGNQSELALPEDYNGKKYMIGPDAFRNNTNLTSVFIPASVTGIEENAFDGCGNLASLTMASPVPPASVYENSFGTINYIYTTLYVPEGSLAAYQTADVWKYFMKIKEYDPTGIEDVVLDTESSNLPVYNLQGVRMKDMDNLPSGIYIQGGKKFIVK